MGLQQRGACRAGVGAAVLALVGVAGCTGQPASTSAWQSSSERVIGTAISGLGTARLVVTQEQRSRLQHSYAVVASTDTIDTTAKEVSSYLVKQPPDQLHDAQAVVTDALQQTVTLLSQVRIELASPGMDAQAAARLVKQIDAMRKALEKLQTGVTSSPAAVSSR